MLKIPLNRRKVALIDADALKVIVYRWNVSCQRDRCYAIATRGRKTISMHRLLLDAPPHLEVDHANGNGLDNRRHNLRLATTSQNQANRKKRDGRNSSGFRGVTWDRQRQKWAASIQVNCRRRNLGRFVSDVEAARAYDAAAKAAWGEFATLNFPEN